MDSKASRLPSIARSESPYSSAPASAALRSLVGAARRALRAVARALTVTSEVQTDAQHLRVKMHSRYPQFWDL